MTTLKLTVLVNVDGAEATELRERFGNDLMFFSGMVGQAVTRLSGEVFDGKLRDVNGNTVGDFSVTAMK